MLSAPEYATTNPSADAIIKHNNKHTNGGPTPV